MSRRKESNFKFLLTVLAESVAIGISVMGSILAGALTGWFIEEKLLKGKTSPWITTLFIILGAIGGLKNLIYFTKKRFKESSKDEPRS